MSNINSNPKSTATQKSLIKEHFLAGKHLTTLDALYLFNCIRLAAVVHTLKKEGFNILTETITTETGKKIADYYIKPEDLTPDGVQMKAM